jgi:hypothetical protein
MRNALLISAKVSDAIAKTNQRNYPTFRGITAGSRI